MPPNCLPKGYDYERDGGHMSEVLGTPTLIKGGLAVDDRGVLRFVNDFNPQDAGVKRFYQVQNHASGFVRAWHGHTKGSKFVYCVQGSAIVLATQLPAIGIPGEDIDAKYVSRTMLSSTCPSMLVIPPNYYNGFKTLGENTILVFFTTTTMEEDKTDDFRLDWDRFGKKIWEVKYR